MNDQSPSASPAPASFSSSGPLYALLAYGAWGLLPIYWKFFGAMPATEVLSHRIIWSVLFLTGILLIQGRQADIWAVLRSPLTLGYLMLSALLLSFNWGIYIYGVNSDRVVETSLGYFINPLVNVCLGYLVFQERLRPAQQVAIVLAAIGVGSFIWRVGTVPWIALGLAGSFASYGLIRKIVVVAPMVGLMVETLLITPLAIAVVGTAAATGQGHWGQSWPLTLLLIGAGVMTSLPLLWFNNAAKRLRFSTLGLFQYVAPSLQLLLGLVLYREPFTAAHALTFSCIWMALALYSWSSWRDRPQPTPGKAGEIR